MEYPWFIYQPNKTAPLTGCGETCEGGGLPETVVGLVDGFVVSPAGKMK